MKKKLFVFLVMMTVMLCMPFLFSLDTEAVMTEDKIFEMKTKAVSLNKGDVVDVTFHVRNMETGGFYGYLNYDTTVLSALTPSQLIPADFSSQVKAVSGSALDVQVDYGTWLASYDAASKKLELREKDKKVVKLPTNADGMLLTMRFTVMKSAPSTTIKLDYPAVYKKNGENSYPTGLALTITNTKTKKLTLATENIKGHSHISIPVKVTENGGFEKLGISVTFDRGKLVFDSVTIADNMKNLFTLDSYMVTQGGAKVIAGFSSKQEQRNTGTLYYFNFHAVDTDTQTTQNTGTTEVTVAIESVWDKAESAYTMTGTKSVVTITEKEHLLGDVNGNGKIDLIDALYAIQYFNRVRTLSDVELQAADVNKNGTVDLVDARLMMQLYNGSINDFTSS